MKFFAFPAAIGLIITLATVTPARNDKKDGRSSEGIERSMPVDPAATITVCVMSGAIEVRGWDKSEIRVRSADEVVLDFRRIDRIKEKEKEKEPQTPATRVDVMVLDKADKTGAKSDCQAVADVELEIPHGATVQVQTRDGDIHIVGVAAAYAGSQNGDIAIEGASRLVEAGSVGDQSHCVIQRGESILVLQVVPSTQPILSRHRPTTLSKSEQLAAIFNSNT